MKKCPAKRGGIVVVLNGMRFLSIVYISTGTIFSYVRRFALNVGPGHRQILWRSCHIVVHPLVE